MNGNRWLITGGCGFIGVNLVSQILRRDSGAHIRILDNLSVGTMKDLSKVCTFSISRDFGKEDSDSGVKLLIGDIKSLDVCRNATDGVDTVVHLAANTGVLPSVEDPRGDLESNVIGTFNMLEAAKQSGTKTFIFSSSGAPLGEVTPPVDEQKAPKPVSPYGASKLSGEAYCSAFFRTYGLKTVSLRFSNVYGPGSSHKNSLVAKFFRKALSGEPLSIYGDGKQTRDFIYIDDLVRAIMLGVNVKIGGEVFQIATSKETTVHEISTRIKNIVEKETNTEVVIVYEKSPPGEIYRSYADITKAKNILGYEPVVDLDTGLKTTFEYFLKERELSNGF